MSEGPIGFLNLHKPKGWTSHDCVAKLRGLLNTRKIGHSGTLDPMATGVLPIAVGQATRLLPYLPTGKAYRAVIQFGLKTETDDVEGEITADTDASALREDQVVVALEAFRGEIEQVPPKYSAIQIDGKRLYDLARRGKSVDIPSRRVLISTITAVDWKAGKHPALTVDIECGPGTYIRAIARDLGHSLGTGATLAALTRTQSNGFKLTNSLTLEQISTAIAQNTLVLTPPEKGVAQMRAIALPTELARRWCLGQKLSWSQVAAETGESAELKGESAIPVRIDRQESGGFLGIGEIRPDARLLAPKRVFYRH